MYNCPDSKVHEANIGPIRVLSAPGGFHVGPMNLAIWVYSNTTIPPLHNHHCMGCFRDGMTWKRFPRYWLFVKGIHWSPVDCPNKRAILWGFDFFMSALTKCWKKNTNGQGYGTPWSSCDASAMNLSKLDNEVISKLWFCFTYSYSQLRIIRKHISEV